MRKMRGVGLIEIMVALVMLLLAATGLTHLLSGLHRDQAEASEREQALLLAHNKLEDLKAFEQLYSDVNRVAYQDIQTDSGGRQGAGMYDQFSLHWQSTDGPDLNEWTPLPAFKRVEIRVDWVDRQRQDQAIVLTARILPVQAMTRERLWLN